MTPAMLVGSSRTIDPKLLLHRTKFRLLLLRAHLQQRTHRCHATYQFL